MEMPLQVYTPNLQLLVNPSMTNNKEIGVILTAALIAMISTTIIAVSVEARFCATPNSPMGQVAEQLIKLQQDCSYSNPTTKP
jgi:hypothetical protein